jgi:hypothetical protein
MLKGTSDEITMVSDPTGADVIANETREGTTPLTFTVPSKQDVTVTVTKGGYHSEDLQDPATFRWGYEACAFIAYVIPMVVDLSDGAAWGHDHLTLAAHLEPTGQAPAAAAAETAPASPFVAAPVAAAQSVPAAAPAPAVHPDGAIAAPVVAPAAVPSVSAMTQQPVPAAPVSAMTQGPAGVAPPTTPAPTTPE